jgi:hypothetical protein
MIITLLLGPVSVILKNENGVDDEQLNIASPQGLLMEVSFE